MRLLNLYNNRQIRLQVGKTARKKVEENFLWEKRGQKMNEIYKEYLK